jgi:hypothetical protein
MGARCIPLKKKKIFATQDKHVCLRQCVIPWAFHYHFGLIAEPYISIGAD